MAVKGRDKEPKNIGQKAIAVGGKCKKISIFNKFHSKRN